MWEAVREIWTGLSEALAPARCMRCFKEGSYLCANCRHHARPLSLNECIVCEHKHPQGLTCWECRNETVLTGVISFGTYNTEWLRRGIEWLKFKSVRGVAPVLAELLAWPLCQIDSLPKLRTEAVLIPIPLHQRRQKVRGFNQSEEIVRALSEASGVPWMNALKRIKYTRPQAQLEKTEREENVTAAFEQVALLPKTCKIVILVDDVMTTGATFESAAMALRPRKQGKIWGLSVAR